MIPRLTVCFALSVLLHGMLLLSVIPSSHLLGRGYPLVSSVKTKKMEVFLEATPSKAKAPAELKKVKSSAKPEAVSSTAGKSTATPPPPVASPAQPPLGADWLVRPPPDFRDPQMNYRQNYEMQARMQAIQQAQMFASRLQTDIEQSINQRGEPVTGHCDWQGETTGFQCNSKLLQRWMQPDADRLSALRSAMKTQGNILDGFTVGSNGNRTTITFRGHSASSGTEP